MIGEGDKILTMRTLVLSCEGVYLLAWNITTQQDIHWHNKRMHTQMCTRIHSKPITLPQSSVRTSRLSTVKVLLFITSCQTRRQHVCACANKKPFMRPLTRYRRISHAVYEKQCHKNLLLHIEGGGKKRHVPQKPCLKQGLRSYLVILIYDDKKTQ